VPRQAFVPAALKRVPFTIDDALSAGLSRRQLEGSTWKRIAPGLYAWRQSVLDELAILTAVRGRLPAGAVFSGRTAAFLHGLDVDPCDPIEITIPDRSASSGWRGITIRRRALEVADVCVAQGLEATSPLRTLLDRARDLPIFDAVAEVDMGLNRGVARLCDLEDFIARNPEVYRAARIRRVIGLTEPRSESPMESLLRLILVFGKLPRPVAQQELYSEAGQFLGRADLYYAHAKLVLEYDGTTHEASLAVDNRRQNLILGAGFRMLRFTAGDLRGRPETVVAQVRAALAA
jgi:uncharacterized protein DUF559